MNVIRIVFLLSITLVLLASVFSSYIVVANGDEGEYGEVEESEIAEGAGDIALYLGVVSVLGYMGYKRAYLAGVRRGFRPPLSLKQALHAHIALAILGGAAAVYHGYVLLAQLNEPFGLAAIIATITVILTGLVLYVSKLRQLRYFARLLHAQRALTAALALLVAAHTVLAD